MTARLVSHREHSDPFVRFPRELLENPALSWKAKALLAWMLDKGDYPGGWETEVARIVSVGSDGKAAVRAMLAELELAGYLTRLDSGSGGRGVRMLWHVSDSKELSENRIVTDPENPIIGLGVSDYRDPAPTHSKTESSKTREGSAKRRHLLPDDFDLSEERRTKAITVGVPAGRVENEFEKFRDHHTSNANRKVDWDAAWRYWARGYRGPRDLPAKNAFDEDNFVAGWKADVS